MRVHCGKHDKIFEDETETCPGCETEKLLLGPDDTLAELRGTLVEPSPEEQKTIAQKVAALLPPVIAEKFLKALDELP